jgi:hypothetical protein
MIVVDMFHHALMTDALNPLVHAGHADWLEEEGLDARLAKLTYECLKSGRRPPEVSLYLFELIAIDPDALEPALSRANGRRRERILTLQQCHACAIGAYRSDSGWSTIAGEPVANAYGYASSRTCCVAARRKDGKVKIGVATGRASKGSSSITPVVPGVLRNSGTAYYLSLWANS